MNTFLSNYDFLTLGKFYMADNDKIFVYSKEVLVQDMVTGYKIAVVNLTDNKFLTLVGPNWKEYFGSQEDWAKVKNATV